MIDTDNQNPAVEPDVEHAHAELVAPSQLSPGRRAFDTLVRSREASILLVLVLVIAAATIKSPSFLFSSNSWRDLLLTPSVLLLLAAGQSVVIITRNVDLSVGSVLGLTAYLTGRLFIDTGLPVLAVILAGVLAGALLGLINGVLVGFGRVPALVITLGHALHLPRRGPRAGPAATASMPPTSRTRSAPSGPRRSCPSRCCSSWRCWSWSQSATTCTPRAVGVSSTRSGQTPTRPSSTA